MERAVPSMTSIADSILPAFRSSIFSSAIFLDLLARDRADLVLLGSPEPFSTPAASLISTDAGRALDLELERAVAEDRDDAAHLLAVQVAVAALNCWMN
jgi:hypothetical protein